ncbi:MAG: hypothetical protein GC185_01390 [Alphaproteobacteria bacterium]|nr:hypothetical protein [Alphaproteobacteria bacterium]
MEEEFNKVGDYTLRVDFEQYKGKYKYEGYTKMFNFLARQVTTTHRDWVCEGRGSSSGGSAAVSAQTRVESFDDLPSTAEVKYMYNKLVELGGKPPALEEVLGDTLDKRPVSRLRQPGAN